MADNPYEQFVSSQPSENPYAQFVKSDAPAPSRGITGAVSDVIKDQFGTDANAPSYNRDSSYLIDNPITRGLGGIANEAAKGIAHWVGATGVENSLRERDDAFATPSNANAAESVAHGIAGVAGAAPAVVLGGAPGAVGLGLATAGAQLSDREAAGEDTSPLQKAGIVATNVATNFLPASLGGSLAKRVIGGAAIGAGSTAVNNLVSGESPTAGILPGALIGAAFGGLHAPHEGVSTTEGGEQPSVEQPAATDDAPVAPIATQEQVAPAKPAGPISSALDAGGVKPPDATATPEPTPVASANPAPKPLVDAYSDRQKQIDDLNEQRKAGQLDEDGLNNLHDLRDVQDGHDPLTGLLNEKGYNDAVSSGQYTHAAALDLDQFKPVNDTFGHKAGDAVLKQVAQILHDQSGGDLAVARLHGDEYAALAKSDPTDVMTAAQKTLRETPLTIKYVDKDGNQSSHTFDGIGITFGVGKNYENADANAIGNKPTGGRRNTDSNQGTVRPADVQAPGGSEAGVSAHGGQDDLQSGREKPTTVKTSVGDVTVDHTHDIPLLGSSSTNGVIHIDKDFDPVIKDGPLKGLDRTPFLVEHEAVERDAEQNGQNYSQSHYDHAEPAEHAALLTHLGLKEGTPEANKAIEAYEASYKDDLKAAASKKNPNVPPDLITKPYEHPHSIAQRKMLDEVNGQQSAATATGSFKTSKGSAYDIHADGTTTRNKAARPDVGHEGDSGAKERSAKTVYVDKDASALSAAGLQNLGEKGARVAIKDGKASLLTWNDKAKSWGASLSAHGITVHDEPSIGRHPLELWNKKNDVPGHDAYGNMHAGNKITELTRSYDALHTAAPGPGEPRQAVTGIKNAQVASEREARHADAIEVNGRRQFPDVWDNAAKKLQDDPTLGRSLAESVIKEPRPLKAEETAVLVRDRVRIGNEQRQAARDVNEAIQAKDKNAEAVARAKLKLADEEMGRNDHASTATGYEQGLGLAMRRAMAAEDYSLQSMQTRMEAKAGRPLTPAEHEQIADLHRQLQEKDDQITALQAKNVKRKPVDLKVAKSSEQRFMDLAAKLKAIAQKDQMVKPECVV